MYPRSSCLIRPAKSHTKTMSALPHTPPPRRPCPAHNRLEAVLVHVDAYLLTPVTSLARDAGVSHSALSRVLTGQAAPSFTLACKIARALERRLGARLPGGHLDPSELFSLDGTYPTPSVCDLAGCPDRPECWRVRAPARRSDGPLT